MSALDAMIARGLTERIREERAARERENELAFGLIRAGSRVTIRLPGRPGAEGQTRTGRAVMKGPAGWVLNLGGRHGTPGIATLENLVKVTPARRK